MSFEVPEKWDLAVAGGDEEDGHFRLEDMLSPRCEVRWKQVKSPADMERVVSGYLKRLAQGAKKGGLEFAAQDEARLPKLGKKFKERDFRTFSWTGTASGYGVAWDCHSCGRVVILQLYGEPDEDGFRLVRSASDHDRGGERSWAVYDLAFSVPSAYKLKKHVLQAGYLELEFASGEKESLRVGRFSLAARMLKQTGLEALIRGKLAKRFEEYRGEVETVEGSEHDVLRRRALKKRRGLVRWLSPLEKKWSAAEEVTYCRPWDKVIVVAWSGRTEKRPDLGRIAGSVKCH